MRIGLVMGPWGMSSNEVVSTVQDAERLGFPTFYLGDHFFVGPPLESWEPYILFTLLAEHTESIRFGPLVTPVTFRAPWNLARLAAQVDLLSDGRFILGLGAGWSEREHAAYGVPYPPLKERFDRLDEAVQVMRKMWGPGPVSFSGRYYQLDEAEVLPKPAPGHPDVLFGGAGEKRTLRLVAEYGNEWSAPTLTVEEFKRKRAILDEHCAAAGRDPSGIRTSLLTMGPIGATQADLDRQTLGQMERTPPPGNPTPEEYREGARARGALVGGPDEILDGLGRLKEAGVDEVLFVHWDGVPEFLAAEVLPKAAAL